MATIIILIIILFVVIRSMSRKYGKGSKERSSAKPGKARRAAPDERRMKAAYAASDRADEAAYKKAVKAAYKGEDKKTRRAEKKRKRTLGKGEAPAQGEYSYSSPSYGQAGSGPRREPAPGGSTYRAKDQTFGNAKSGGAQGYAQRSSPAGAKGGYAGAEAKGSGAASAKSKGGIIEAAKKNNLQTELDNDLDAASENNMDKVRELMVKGPDDSISFARDFVAEGTEMMNSYLSKL